MAQKVIVFGVDGLIPELIYKFTKEGHLPHISRMLEEGASTQLLPFISAWGDVNWVSFLAGQSPGTCWKGQAIPAGNEDNLLGYMQESGKRCALVHFPESLSAKGTNHFEFAPFWSGTGGAPFELAAAAVHTTDPEKWPAKSKTEFLGWPPLAGTLAHHEKQNIRTILKEGGELSAVISGHGGIQQKVAVRFVNDQEIELTLSGRTAVRLRLNEWTDWVNIPFQDQQGTVRFKLLEIDRVNQKMDFLQTQINLIGGFSNDAKLGRVLLDKCGPFISKWAVKAGPDELYADTSFEEGEYQAMWLADAALTLINEHGFDVFATVFRLPDETQHTCLGEYDPASPFHSADRADICEKFMRRSYISLDKTIGAILDGKSDDTVLILASDHGNVPNTYLCDIYRRLEQCGLCKMDTQGGLVLQESKAYLKSERGGLEIYVNLKGRDPSGIVDIHQYEQVQTEIFHAMSTWYHETPKGNQNVVGMVLKKQDAAPIGYWGEEAGDVIFAYSQGFVWGMNTRRDVVAPVSSPGANHGPQMPSAVTDHSSNFGIALFHGRQIRNGVRIGRTAPYRMHDAGATIASLIGVGHAPGLDGSVMNKLIVV